MPSFSDYLTIIGMLFAGGSALVAVVAWFISRIGTVEDELSEKIDHTEARLNEFKLQVAKEYASISYMKDIEERLVLAINSLSKSVDDMPKRVAEILASGRSDGNQNRRSR